jgi:hypothetical protein
MLTRRPRPARLRYPRFHAAMMLMAAAALPVPARAAVLLTDAAGYRGPVLDLSSLDSPLFRPFATPVALPGGITAVPQGRDGLTGSEGYGFGDNGVTFGRPIIGSNSSDAAISLRLAVPVSQFGVLVNYALLDGQPLGASPSISAFDAAGRMVGRFDLFTAAPINTPGAINAFAFRGISADGIARLDVAGSFIAVAGGTGVAAVPEPGSWALLIAGFGLVGATLRQRRYAPA